MHSAGERSARVLVHLVRAGFAGIFTALAFIDLSVVVRGAPRLVTELAQLVLIPFIVPAMVILSFFGVRGGPDGMPAFAAVAVLTFGLLWGFLETAPVAWRRLKAEMRRQREDTPIDPGERPAPR